MQSQSVNNGGALSMAAARGITTPSVSSGIPLSQFGDSEIMRNWIYSEVNYLSQQFNFLNQRFGVLSTFLGQADLSELIGTPAHQNKVATAQLGPAKKKPVIKASAASRKTRRGRPPKLTGQVNQQQ